MTSLSILLIIPYGFMTVAWFVMLQGFFKDLAANHPQLYKELGSPTLFVNNSISNNIRLLRFLAAHNSQVDVALASRARLLYRWIVASLSLFLLMIFGLVWASATVAAP